MLLSCLLLVSVVSAFEFTLDLHGSDSDYISLIKTIQQQFSIQVPVAINPSSPSATKLTVLLPGSDLKLLDNSNDTNKKFLVIGATLDGVNRFSTFATTSHIHTTKATSTSSTFVVIEGASYHSFSQTSNKNVLDLDSEISNAAAQKIAATLIYQWSNEQNNANTAEQNNVNTPNNSNTPKTANNNALKQAKLRATQLAAPIIKALELEGSAHTGKDICNSDFPTNPTCNYPIYPDFSLPPGPAKAPSPLPSKDCICGSKWVENFAFPSLAGASDKGFTVHTADAFHDVSDVHPFHLPHDWNSCTTSKGCVLNMTTLTMNVNGSGNLFPNTSSVPLSALELRTKMKSRKIIWEAAGLGKQSGDVDKKNMTLCKNANQMAWDWALENADAAVRQRFMKSGTPFVMVDDVEAPIGLSGPTWIKKELMFTRTANNTIEVQSWTFVVPESPIKSKYLPTGMHYCKLLSPARCMEWIYTDGLRKY